MNLEFIVSFDAVSDDILRSLCAPVSFCFFVLVFVLVFVFILCMYSCVCFYVLFFLCVVRVVYLASSHFNIDTALWP